MLKISLGVDTSGRALILDDRTLAKLRHAEARLGHTFTVVQGSYRAGDGAQASAGTHDRGGVIDLRTWNLPADIAPERAVRVLRESGLIAWYRTEAQGFDPHFHAIDYGNPDLAPAAAGQVEAWEQGYNGLASYGPDDGPRVAVPKNPPTPEPSEEDDDMRLTDPLNANDPKGNPTTASVTVGEALSAFVIFVSEGQDAAKKYLDRARQSAAPKES